MNFSVRYNRDVSETLLRTKLFVPPLRPLLVPRLRLVERLNQGASSKLILVAAPAGFGKTTLVTYWLQQQTKPVAWLSLDEHDNELMRFFLYVLTAVQTVYPDCAVGLMASLQAADSLEPMVVMSTFVNELSRQTSPLLLVLDDYHVIHNELIHDALSFLIDYMPPYIHVVLTSREDPPLTLPRWRVRGQLEEVRDTDLRFTAEEAASFLADTMGLSLPDTAVSALETRTEGWVAGLQLAALSIRNQDSVSAEGASAFINTFTGNNREVADYLLQEVLFQQSDEVQQFLLNTAVLQRFNADLGNHLVAQTNAQAILDSLEQSNLFLIPLDNQRYWYRYHHLFSQLLRERLRRDVGQTAVAKLHGRAAEWYAAEKLLEEAVNHALQIPDYAYAAELISRFDVFQLYEQGMAGLVMRWVAALPDEIIAQYPQTGILMIGAAFVIGDIVKAQYYLRLIAPITAVRAEYNLFQSIVVRNETADHELALQLTQESFATLSGRNDKLAVMALMQMAVNQQNLGYLSASEQSLSDIRRRLHSTAKPQLNIILQVIFMQAAAARSRADLYRAQQICQEGVDMAHRAGEPSAPMLGWLYALMAAIHYEWNEIEPATQYADLAMEWAERTAISDIFVQAHMIRADLACLTRDMDTIRQVVQELIAYAKKAHLDEVIEITETLSAHYFLRGGDLDSAVRWANASGYSLNDEPTFIKFDTYFTLLEIRLAESWALGEKRRAPQLLAMLQKLELFGRDTGYTRGYIRTVAAKAVVLDWMGNRQEALNTLQICVDLAQVGSMIRIFLDWGEPMHQFLKRSVALHDPYITRLLHAFAAENTAVSAHPPQQTLPAIHLTAREQDVLHAIVAGLSNKEIEQSLFISKNTVRTHLKNLYNKLDVDSRTQAIAKAQELDLL